MILVLCMILSALAGDTDVDAVGRIDSEGVGGAPQRVLSASYDLQISPAEWPSCRLAAVQGQAQFDAWVAGSGKPGEVKSFYASLPPAWRDAVRRSALGLAP